ncbi:MAG: DUF3224 domain-containing protein [Marmoricola sp.]
MRTTSTFTVASFEPTEVLGEVATASAVGVSRMVKEFTGGLTGRSTTLFTAAFDHASGVGTYLAMESFEGTLDGRSGSVNIAHTATTDGGPERLHELVLIVPGSGTGELAGITGTGALRIDEDGTHHLELEYAL